MTLIIVSHARPFILEKFTSNGMKIMQVVFEKLVPPNMTSYEKA